MLLKNTRPSSIHFVENTKFRHIQGQLKEQIWRGYIWCHRLSVVESNRFATPKKNQQRLVLLTEFIKIWFIDKRFVSEQRVQLLLTSLKSYVPKNFISKLFDKQCLYKVYLGKKFSNLFSGFLISQIYQIFSINVFDQLV